VNKLLFLFLLFSQTIWAMSYQESRLYYQLYHKGNSLFNNEISLRIDSDNSVIVQVLNASFNMYCAQAGGIYFGKITDDERSALNKKIRNVSKKIKSNKNDNFDERIQMGNINFFFPKKSSKAITELRNHLTEIILTSLKSKNRKALAMKSVWEKDKLFLEFDNQSNNKIKLDFEKKKLKILTFKNEKWSLVRIKAQQVLEIHSNQKGRIELDTKGGLNKDDLILFDSTKAKSESIPPVYICDARLRVLL